MKNILYFSELTFGVREDNFHFYCFLELARLGDVFRWIACRRHGRFLRWTDLGGGWGMFVLSLAKEEMDDPGIEEKLKEVIFQALSSTLGEINMVRASKPRVHTARRK